MSALSLILAASLVQAQPISVRDFGAVGDGAAQCTRQIQAAIDSAAKRKLPTVIVPAGRFLTGSLHMRSHVELRLAKGAVLLGSCRLADYDRGVWRSLIIGANLQGASITGSGTIDGNAAELLVDVKRLLASGELKIPPHSWRPSELDRPEILEFSHCNGVRIQGVTLKHALCWVQTYRDCEGLAIDHVNVDSKTYWNNDGIDLVDCKRTTVTNCDIDADDDGICLKSDTPGDRCDDIQIAHCRIRSSASAIKFGTSSHGGFRNVRIDDVHIHDTFRSAIALESVDGGILEDIVASHVRAVNIGNAFFIRLGHRTTSAPVGRIRNVELRDFDVQVPAGQPDLGYPFQGPQYKEPHNVYPASIVGLPGYPVQAVALKNIRVRMAGGGDAAVASAPLDALASIPERPASYPEFSMWGELPAWGLYLRHAQGISVQGLTLSIGAADYRPAVVADDIRGIQGHVGVAGNDPLKQFITYRCRDVHVSGNLHTVSVDH